MSALRNRSTTSPPGPMLVPVGQHQGQPSLPVSRHFTVAGSAPSARVYLPSKSVSRCHAAIINTGHGLFVRDLASRSGVRVNGRAVREADLRDGDVLQFGSYTFRFADPAPQHAATPAPPVPAGALEVDGLDEPLPLDARTLLIGRRETADVSLTESSASSAHALIFESEGKHLLRDLSSRTGTFVNGVKVHEHPLSSGDVIRVGETSFGYVRTGGETRADREEDTSNVAEVPAEAPVEAPPDSAAPTPFETAAPAAGDFDFTPLDVAPADTPADRHAPAPASGDDGEVESGPGVSVGLVEHGETLRATDVAAAQPAPQVPEVGDLIAPWEVDEAPAAADPAPIRAGDSAPAPEPMPDLSEPKPAIDNEPEKEPELELDLAPSEAAPPPFAQTPIPAPEPEPPAERKRVDVPPPKKESRRSMRANVQKPPPPPAAANPPAAPSAAPRPAPPPARVPAPKPAPAPRAPVPPTPAAQRPARPRSPFDVLGGADDLEPLPETPQHPPPEPPAHEAHRGHTDE